MRVSTATHWPPRQYDDTPEPAPDWMDFGLCLEVGDPDLWFPAKSKSPRPAKKVCRSCEVRTQCLAYAMDNGIEEGVWGATTDADRRKLRLLDQRFDVAA